ncbi:hypothetical protein SAMN02927923_03449 [Microvirga guangxiensis]|uniref:Uncharacterized protein n=2 Tax=Microvirga guangxiensis TaxID=549386 RepID=A0A1G5KNG1_9HYPH|nr:hypothetical protein SAMN02927923_03449 [Microvirga guangxiensis]
MIGLNQPTLQSRNETYPTTERDQRERTRRQDETPKEQQQGTHLENHTKHQWVTA